VLKTVVKIAEYLCLAAALAFVVMLFVNADDVEEVQETAARFEEEAAVAVEECEKVKGAGNCGPGAAPADDGDDGDDEAGGGGDEETTTTEGDDGGGEADGAAIFAQRCASCHGDDGGGGSGPNLQDNDNADGVADVVTNGRGGMPSFEGRLSEEEIQAVATFVAEEL
jgi:mono/diheme cytochrome c family protein